MTYLKIRKYIFAITVFCLLFIPSFTFAEVKVYFEGDVPEGFIKTLPYWVKSASSVDEADWLVTLKKISENKISRYSVRIEWDSKTGLYILLGGLAGGLLGTLASEPDPVTGERSPDGAILGVLIGGVLGGLGGMRSVPGGRIDETKIEYTILLTNVFTAKKIEKKLKQTFSYSYEISKSLEDIIVSTLIDDRGDKSPPFLNISSPLDQLSYETFYNNLSMHFQAIDDVELAKVSVYIEIKKFESLDYKNRKNIEEVVKIPLQLGDNKIKITAEDWCGKTTSKEVTIFRKKLKPGEKPEEITTIIASARPSIDFSISLLENISIWRGCERVGFIVAIENKGKGKGEVDVVFSGDEYLLKLFGKVKSLGEIEPGKTKSGVFAVDLPAEPPEKEATLYVEVKEKLWGESPMKKKQIRVSLLPAEKGPSRPPPEPLLPSPKVFANARSNAYALIIGIQDYQQIGKLKYSQKDAEAFKYYCNGVLGIPEKNTRTLHDQQATGLPLITAIKKLGEKKNASMLVFYYSGHGSFNPENPREDTLGYIVPVDGNPDMGVGTLIPLKDVVSWLEASSADTILVIIDACFSGNPEMGKTPQIAQKAGVSPKIVVPPSKKAIVLTSTTSAKPSLEYDDAGYSYFTYYLLLGLKGKADKDDNNWITVDEACDYACENVELRTEGKQVPLKSGGKGEIKLGKYR